MRYMRSKVLHQFRSLCTIICKGSLCKDWPGLLNYKGDHSGIILSHSTGICRATLIHYNQLRKAKYLHAYKFPLQSVHLTFIPLTCMVLLP